MAVKTKICNHDKLATLRRAMFCGKILCGSPVHQTIWFTFLFCLFRSAFCLNILKQPGTDTVKSLLDKRNISAVPPCNRRRISFVCVLGGKGGEGYFWIVSSFRNNYSGISISQTSGGNGIGSRNRGYSVEGKRLFCSSYRELRFEKSRISEIGIPLYFLV